VNALIFGASGGLATALADTLLSQGSPVDLVTRAARRAGLDRHFEAAPTRNLARLFTVERKYSDFEAAQPYDAYFFTQALFSPKPLASMDGASIASEIEVGLTDPIRLTGKLLAQHPPVAGQRRDYCYVGSTSAYAGFKNTSVYCAVKHGLLGFVRAMNDEYSQSDARFWLFSMGTMNTEMGAKLKDQDPASFLQPGDVARRMIEAVCSPSNLFEPEVLIRRRAIRFREK
jgi:NAD(P)-dependent dehydrogenase (short-subunit alcohol dehydrogenase family)